MVALPEPYFSKSEYVTLENAAQYKSEYLDGQIYAMAGGSPNHSRLGGKVFSLLDAQLRGKPCEPFNGDTRVEIRANGMTFYPDALVACPPLEYSPDDPYALTNPVTIIEVLSPSTEKFDRSDKWAHYQLIPTLRDYVLISQDKMRVEHYARQSDNRWLLSIYQQPEETARLEAVDCLLKLADVYERVVFDAAPQADAA